MKSFICSLLSILHFSIPYALTTFLNFLELYHFMVVSLIYGSTQQGITNICLFLSFIQILYYIQFSLTWFSHSLLFQRCINVHSVVVLYIIPLREYTINDICILLLIYIYVFQVLFSFVLFSL